MTSHFSRGEGNCSFLTVFDKGGGG